MTDLAPPATFPDRPDASARPRASASEPAGAPPPGAPLAPIVPLRAPGLPSTTALALARATRRELELAVLRGTTPEIEGLVGWEFRGINATPPGTPPIARLAGVQKFVKGVFRADDGRVLGYNSPVAQNALDGR
ncbi:MAG TPA: hypothetical protein VFT22_41070, partial [Kofleriaceae bacterium]|nr:hypothetical protein [Kofleriaceae bacterium]